MCSMNKIKIIFDNVYTKIKGASSDIENIIWNELSFRVEEFNSDNVRIRHLFNRKTKKTYTGLLDYVIEILNNQNEEYQLIDKRKKHKKNANFKLKNKINVNGKDVPLITRPYQQKVIDNCSEREIIQAATGAGKTFIMAALIAKYNVKPVAVFADKISLCTQIKDEFEKFLGIPIGIVGGGMNQKEDITVYSVQSATKDDINDAKMILFDECLSYYEKVLMEDGTYEYIGKLVDEKSNKRVLSYNHNTRSVEPKRIISHSKIPLMRNNKKMMKLVIRKPDGTTETIKCTDNHKIWINNLDKYVQVKDLSIGQTVKLKK